MGIDKVGLSGYLYCETQCLLPNAEQPWESNGMGTDEIQRDRKDGEGSGPLLNANTQSSDLELSLQPRDTRSKWAGWARV